MSFIDFESGWEKDKARQELREVRAELLKRAEENAKRRDEKELQKKFRGDDQWMLPSVSKRIGNLSTESSSSKKKEKKSKKAKKSSKKHKKEKKKNKKRKKSSSNESDDSSEEEERVSKRKRKRKHFSDVSSSGSSDSESDEDAWVEKDQNKDEQKPVPESKTVSLQRDDWLSGFSSISTFSKEPKERKKEERKGIDAYKPGKCARELNPYWKDGGDGLPKAFAKPKYDSDDDEKDSRRSYQSKTSERGRQSNWKKRVEPQKPSTSQSIQDRAPRREPQRRSSSSSSSSSRSPSPSAVPKTEELSKSLASRNDFLTDQQMNELGAKLVKAEIMGNDDLANELKGKLDRARKYRTEHKSEVLAKSYDRRAGGSQNKKQDKESEVVLSTTNSKGLSRPVNKYKDDSDLWGGRAGRKAKKQKPVETHAGGERVRYFADDDRYDIKQMFEAEKFTSAADQDMQFADIAGKHKDPNDDLEDIFADKVRKNLSEGDMDRKERDRAIRQHQDMERTLDNCDRCFDSVKLEKQLIVSLGKNVYLAMPWHEGLTTGHCIIAPLAHVSCSTQLDDDVWVEIKEFMTALNRMFSSRKQDVIFFETARYLHRRPHMVIHCVPSSEFEMAPFYFKKAIQESETEWSTNKQLVSLKEKDLRRSIPKGLPYFWVNFGMDSGFAHVIEDQDQFPSNFAQETIGGLLNLDARLWRRPRKIHNPIPKVKQFADWWKLFDFTR